MSEADLDTGQDVPPHSSSTTNYHVYDGHYYDERFRVTDQYYSTEVSSANSAPIVEVVKKSVGILCDEDRTPPLHDDMELESPPSATLQSSDSIPCLSSNVTTKPTPTEGNDTVCHDNTAQTTPTSTIEPQQRSTYTQQEWPLNLGIYPQYGYGLPPPPVIYNPIQSYSHHYVMPPPPPPHPSPYPYYGYYPCNQQSNDSNNKHHNRETSNTHDKWIQHQQHLSPAQDNSKTLHSSEASGYDGLKLPITQELCSPTEQYKVQSNPKIMQPVARGRGSGRGRWNQAPVGNDQHSNPKKLIEDVDNPGGLQSRHQSSSATTNERERRIALSKDPTKWPPKLKNYLMRSFEACTHDADRDHVEQYLKVEVTAMFEDMRVWQIDWDNEPLPLNKIKRQGQKRKSRWDTPSPNADLRHSVAKQSPSPSSPHTGTVQDRLGDTKVGIGRGRGRGRGKKMKNQWKKGKFFIDRTGNSSSSYEVSEKDQAKVNLRSQRFARGSDGDQGYKPKLSIEQLMKTVCVSGEEDWKGSAIEGKSQALEKRYLRLTSAPDPSSVRPVVVLVKSMEYVLSQWNNKKDYHYACEQFKAIRQDLTIQNIRNQFSVEVYETHGRIALQNGDWGEFNQCQSQLRSMYKDGIQGHRAEFMSYRILYHMMTNEIADLNQILTEITGDLLTDSAVDHALKLRRAWSFGNYYQFFQLYPSTPHCGRYLVDLFLERVKKNALKTLSKAYRPTLAVDYITKILRLTSVDECRNFLESCDTVFNGDKTAIDCKLTLDKLTR